MSCIRAFRQNHHHQPVSVKCSRTRVAFLWSTGGRAAAQAVPAAGVSDASAHFRATSGWWSRCTSRKTSTTAMIRRWSQWRRGARRRRRSTRRTSAYGHRWLRLWGCRRVVSLPPGPPQLVAATVRYVAAGTLPLVVVLVAAQDGLDDATVQFLLLQTLLERAAEEEEWGETFDALPRGSPCNLQSLPLRWAGDRKVGPSEEEEEKDKEEPVMETILFTREPFSSAPSCRRRANATAPGTDC